MNKKHSNYKYKLGLQAHKYLTFFASYDKIGKNRAVLRHVIKKRK